MNYSDYEKSCGNTYLRTTIEGRNVGCGKCVGYCRYEGHPGFLTDRQRRQHRCSEKGCFHNLAKPQHSERTRQQEEKRLQQILRAAQDFTEPYEGLRIVNIVQQSRWYVLRYAAITDVHPIHAIEESLSRTLGIPIAMNKIDCEFDVAASLVFSR